LAHLTWVYWYWFRIPLRCVGLNQTWAGRSRRRVRRRDRPVSDAGLLERAGSARW